MESKRLGTNWFRIWLSGGIMWVFATVVFAGIPVPPTPEQLNRENRIRVIKAVERILTWGSAAYAVLGVLAFFRKRFLATLAAGANIFLATGLIAGFTINCYHAGQDEYGYRAILLIPDAMVMVIFPGPLWGMLLFEMRSITRKRLFAVGVAVAFLVMPLAGQYGLVIAAVMLAGVIKALVTISKKPVQANTSLTTLP
jgi:hypothetical protein